MPISNNLLLAVRTKKTSKVDVKGPVTKYIVRVYGQQIAEEAEDDLDTVQEIRNEIVGAASSTVGLGQDKFAKYYRALCAMETRFPISSDSSQVVIAFTWWDSFKDNLKATQKNVHFEKAAILFCLVSIASQRGIEVVRTTEEGMKDAVEQFCFAAGILAHLKDVVTIKTEQPRPVDLSGECCCMLERLMLAQAQEVFYEISALKHMSPAVCARIAKQVSLMYSEVSGHYNKPQLANHFEKGWTYICRSKAVMYDAEALLQAAFGHHKDKDHGKYLSRLRSALKVLDDHRKDIKLASADLQGHCKAVEDRIRADLKTAEEDNVKVYMEIVPHENTLPPIQPHLLVKAKLPDYLSRGPETWFQSIVPDKAAKNLSRYTELMDERVRGLLNKLDSATDEARLCLAQHDLPAALDALSPGNKDVPEDVRAALNDDFLTSGGLNNLQGLARNVADIRGEVQAELARCAGKLDEESAADEAMRSKWGAQWRRPASNVLAGPLRETIARYEANLKAAGESDARVLQKLDANRDRLGALSIDQVAARVPTLKAPMVATGDPATVVATLRQALDVLSGLGQERASLEEKVKEARDRDNVLPALMARGDEPSEAVFSSQLEQYAPLGSAVDTNVARQAEILTLISRSFYAFKAAYDVDAWRSQCDAAFREVKADVGTGREVMSNLREGIQFYSGLQDAVKKLSQMCSDLVMTRGINCQELDEDLTQKRARNPAHKLLAFVGDSIKGGHPVQDQNQLDAEAARRMQAELQQAGLASDMNALHVTPTNPGAHPGPVSHPPGSMPPPAQPWNSHPQGGPPQQQQQQPPQGYSPYAPGQHTSTAPYAPYAQMAEHAARTSGGGAPPQGAPAPPGAYVPPGYGQPPPAYPVYGQQQPPQQQQQQGAPYGQPYAYPQAPYQPGQPPQGQPYYPSQPGQGHPQQWAPPPGGNPYPQQHQQPGPHQ